MAINAGTGNISIGDDGVSSTINIGGVTPSASDIVNIATNATVADTVNIGSSNAGSSLSLQGGAFNQTNNNTGVSITTTSNTTSAYSIKTAGGADVFSVDLNSQWAMSFTNPSVEVNTTGWSMRAGTASMTQNPPRPMCTMAPRAWRLRQTTANAGVNYTQQLSPSTAYCFKCDGQEQ